MKRLELLASAAFSCCVCTTAQAQVAAQTTAPPAQTASAGSDADQSSAPETSPAAGGDIIVTAQRQSQRLQDIPIAISAFSAQGLERQQIVNSVALQQLLPNVTFTKTNFTNSSFTIRGIGDLCVGTTCDSAAAIHVNDMPLLNTRLFESGFFDLQRVEVLRGPQGTLFGRNATSGVVNFISARPDLSRVGAAGEFEYGNYYLHTAVIGDKLLSNPRDPSGAAGRTRSSSRTSPTSRTAPYDRQVAVQQARMRTSTRSTAG